MPVIPPRGLDEKLTYPSVGACIYCYAKYYDASQPGRRLALEHIVPEALGGSLLLPEASCARCEGITSSFEGTVCRRIFGPLRIHFGMPTKRPKDRPHSLPVRAFYAGEEEPRRVEVPLSEHPYMCTLVELDPPLLLGPPQGGKRVLLTLFPAGKVVVDRQMAELCGKLKAERIEIATTIATDEFLLMLAKIAHAGCVARFGIGNFQAFLPDLIRRKDAAGLGLYVGAGEDRPPADGTMHHFGVRHLRRGRQLLAVVEIGLFKAAGLPSYDVVAGRLYEDGPEIHKPSQTGDGKSVVSPFSVS